MVFITDVTAVRQGNGHEKKNIAPLPHGYRARFAVVIVVIGRQRILRVQ